MVLRYAQAKGRVNAVPLFVGSYLVVWALLGVAVYEVYRPHGTITAGAVAIAAGVYELTSLKQHFRRRCRQSVRSGFEFGVNCFGSSVGLMMMMVALGVMSVTWMIVIAVIVLAQKLLPAKVALDVPPVSYTHLDVYKRQPLRFICPYMCITCGTDFAGSARTSSPSHSV